VNFPSLVVKCASIIDMLSGTGRPQGRAGKFGPRSWRALDF
jgi:hypothetical protein